VAFHSKYLILGSKVFRSPDGRSVRGAFDTTTASLYVVPEQIAQALDDQSSSPTRAQIQALTRAGLLAGAESGDSYLERLQDASEDLSSRTFILLPTPACNMGCAYCGQDHGGHSLKSGYEDLVVPRIMATIEDPSTRIINIDWFGGEPLLAKAEMFSIASQLMRHARAHQVEYRSQLTTNGSLFTPSLLEKLVVDAGVTRIDVTVDGPRHTHDASRKMKNGTSTYDRILDSVRSALEQPWSTSCRFIIRSNVTMSTLPFVTEYLHDLAARGMTGARGPTLQVAPVHDWGVGADAYEVSMAAFAAAEVEWFNLAVDLDLNFMPLPDLEREPCSAGQRGTETIDPRGVVYDCPEFALRPEGPVFVALGRRPENNSLPRPDGALMADMTWSSHVESPPCRSCELLPVCGGACALSRAEGRAQCPTMRYNFPDRVDAAIRRTFASAERNGRTV
jgi:uncharacterized protein